MSVRYVLAAALVTAACAGAAAPTPAPAPGPNPPSAAAAAPSAIRLIAADARYLIQTTVHIEQSYAGLPPTMDVGFRVFLHTVPSGPVDSAGTPLALTVDSIVPDSGFAAVMPVDLSAARGYQVRGRLSPAGELRDITLSDSGTASVLSQVLPRFRNFFPRVPAAGVAPGNTWTDTATVTEGAGGAMVTTTSIARHSAGAWEDRAGTRVLRLDAAATFEFSGTGSAGGGNFTISGKGSGTGVQYLGADGRYAGAESHDSTTLTIELPMQGISIPRRQMAHTVVSLLP